MRLMGVQGEEERDRGISSQTTWREAFLNNFGAEIPGLIRGEI
jgi:hypothetical protein